MSRIASMHTVVGAMARKKPTGMPQPSEDVPRAVLHQVNLRLDRAYFAQIERAASLLGLDPTQLLRMIVREHFPEYQERANEVARRMQDHE